ncbi:MAG: hypothetical protein IJ688_04705 [Treponema sp.]|nr:hypothetical protein [Treponema sp.]
MKKLILSTFITFVAALYLNAQTIAVLGFEADSFNLESRKGTMSNLLTDELVGIDNITVLERSQIDKVLEEMDFQVSGYTDAKTAKTIGSMINADCIITGSVAMFGDKMTVTARTIEVETAKIISSAKMTCSTWSDFNRQLPQFAEDCVKKMPVPNRFSGVWQGSMTNDFLDDYYEITFTKNNRCQIILSTTDEFGDITELTGTGSYSYTKDILRINARLATELGVSRKINWLSSYHFSDDYSSFTILVKPDKGSQENVAFAKIGDAE